MQEPWSENATLFERLMEIHSNPPIIYYGFNVFFCLKIIQWILVPKNTDMTPDNFLIYKVKNGSMKNGSPSYVFNSRKAMAEIAFY